MENIIPILPLDSIAAAAILIATLVYGIVELAKKLGATDKIVIGIAITSGQILSLGYWISLQVFTWPGLYLAVIVGLGSTLFSMGLWKTIQPRQPPPNG